VNPRTLSRAVITIALLLSTTAAAVATAGEWALLASAPLLGLIPVLVRWRGVRATRRQTVACLSRVTELGGHASAGHPARVSALAGRLARELGLSESYVVELERAALLHDVGQLALPAPVHGGHTALLDTDQARHIAQVGAGMLRATGGMDGVAALVEAQAEPFRAAPPTGQQAMGARILKVANAYDDLVGADPAPGAVTAALWRMRRAGDSAYDPQVLDALSRLVAGAAVPRSR
jgi:HD-GYP domain-containing protein (c-di-GMP phosphodiesterase class II)